MPTWFAIGQERAASPDPINGTPRVGSIVASVEGGRGEGYTDDFTARQTANARPIASAPDMAEALKPFGAFLAVHSTLGGTAPKRGEIYTVTTSAGEASITVEHLKAAVAALAKAHGG